MESFYTDQWFGKKVLQNLRKAVVCGVLATDSIHSVLCNNIIMYCLCLQLLQDISSSKLLNGMYERIDSIVAFSWI